MARKSKRVSHHRRSRRSHRTPRTHGGVAPIHQNDIGWSSKMSLGQGGDYFNYHVGQHGGVQLQGADLSVIGGEGLPSSLRSAALLGNQDRALYAIRGMSDQLGGRRTKRSKKSHRRKSGKRKSHGGKRKSHGGKRKTHHRKHRSHRRHSRRRGGAQHMGFAPVNAQSMLLDSASDYVKGVFRENGTDLK